ncbi:DUF4440 domain-containing protein [Lelliottia sp. V89_10]|uniref:DUF4440 domain-containing protein n=1 Tax=Lelliottia wanjuensis TaxID=3050585 RepID=UPI00249DBEDF|nr:MULTISPECIES: DUF4440 domain-containing protein [unclassified Lelliottia]MDI3360156.1 DUF4440 domain-containing protein [Lelliottia sp. V89_13]MDK9550443.1 DUF4440 domain-containing protein [Lelliottia sp. V89_5]MDK9594821.1 DUF4440 domain-containing protein [Lelliottia sp. V89_10]
MNTFENKIIETHVAIENWLGKGAGDLEALMAHFSETFSMVTLTGACLDYPALKGFFLAQRRGRPGLSITVDCVEVLETWQEGAALRYREIQSQPSAATTVRWSTVLLIKQGESVLWRHLHETAQG